MTSKYSLNERVCLVESGEEGTVIGRSEFVHAEASVLIRYRAADGRQVEEWWTEGAVESVAIDGAIPDDTAH